MYPEPTLAADSKAAWALAASDPPEITGFLLSPST